jgi:Aspartyl/Asparaginyl beta-hydroxylase
VTSPIKLLPLTLNVEPAFKALSKSIRWNAHQYRTNDPASPHREVSDIYARYAPLTWQEPQPFKAEWYAYPELTAVLKPLAAAVYDYVDGIELGGVLITKIPAGKQVYPHVDHGYHATTFTKVCVCIRANEEQSFNFEGQSLRTKTGTCFFFDNSYSHWVLNPSTEDRISMIVCVRTARGVHQP